MVMLAHMPNGKDNTHMAENAIQRGSLGNTDLEVSNVCFGTYKLGIKPAPEEALDLLGHAFDAGVNFIDTSDNYRAAELLIGQALREGILPRDEVVIATKTGLARSEYEDFGFQVDGREQDASPQRLKRRAEGSLRMLGVDTIDLFQVHVHDPAVEPLEIAVAMNELITEGKIRHWGVSNYNEPKLVTQISQASETAGLVGPVSLQDHYSLFDKRFEPVIDTARSLGMSILAFSPLKKGAISGKIFADISAYEDALADDSLDSDSTEKIQSELAIRSGLLD